MTSSPGSPQLPFKPHPIIAAPTEAQVQAMVTELGAEEAARQCQAIELQRLELIQKMDDDRFHFGYVIPVWREAVDVLAQSMLLALFGGNGSSKTVFSVWYAVTQVLVARPNMKVLFLHESETSSIGIHQSFVYDYLPPEWRPHEGQKMKRTLTTKVNYSRADGFTNNVFVLPNGSLCRFGFYGQKLKDYEGGGWNLIVADENLPLNWLKTLLIRLPRANGKMIWSFTPVDGITPAVKHVVDGAKTLKSQRADLLSPEHRVSESQDWPAGEMPTLQDSVLPSTFAMYFRADGNPFAGYEMFRQTLLSMSTVDIERRAYGWARNTLRALFPRFGKVHLLTGEKMDAQVTGPAAESQVTKYHVVDPAGARNMFMLWVAVDGEGRHFIYREWPDAPRNGEWAVPSEMANRFDGDPGPAQANLGHGVTQYKRLILEEEGNRQVNGRWEMCGEPIFERIMDSRSGRAQAIAEDAGGVSLIDRFEEEQTDGSGPGGNVIGPEMEFRAAAGVTEERGFEMINNLLAYEPLQPITPLLNEPKLYISDRCENLIWALRNYTQRDGEKAACKDPIDCLRYIGTAALEHIPAGALHGLAGGSY